MIFPVQAPNHFYASFGEDRGDHKHQGIDIFAPVGAYLYAAEEGKISIATNKIGGNAVNLTGKSNTRYYYAHLSAFDVKDGDSVSAGEVIGRVGVTGNARGTHPHLHFEMHPNGGAASDPYESLMKAEVKQSRPRSQKLAAIGLVGLGALAFAWMRK